MNCEFPVNAPSRLRCVLSPSAARRLEAARAFALAYPPSQPLTIVAATRGAADDFARSIARTRPATIGLSRFSLTQLAARIAGPRLAGAGVAPASALALEAVAARAAFEAQRHDRLSVLSAIADTPGFPRALTHTLGDLRMASVPLEHVRGGADKAATAVDLSHLVEESEQELAEAHVADRARLFDVARGGVAEDRTLAHPLILLDVDVASQMELAFVHALVTASSEVFATVSSHDKRAKQSWAMFGADFEDLEPAGDGDLRAIQEHLFWEGPLLPRVGDGSFEFFSAPGEGRECVEIARRILQEARRGVAFDEIAVLVRAPAHYLGLIEHALARAGVPAYFERGTRRPHAGGRAFLALLACADEGLSANRFAEYLSLGQLPPAGVPAPVWVPPGDEVFAGISDAAAPAPPEPEAPLQLAHDDQPEIAGTLRTPRRWEWMLVEAAVIGGDPERWRRRLDGFAEELRIRLEESRRADPESSLSQALERDAARLAHLASFALPLIRDMAAWPERATWGEWLERFEQLAPRVLRAPGHVLRVLADLRPMAAVGPVGLREVRAVLSERLRLVEADPPPRRYGRVFIGSPQQASGRSFKVVFVPGVAERVFPQKARQDPLLPDRFRAYLTSELETSSERGLKERQLLHLAVGAATERLYLSYPRLDVGESRVRVPSFYALDAMRAVTGRIPDHEELAAAAVRAGNATLAWPAPPDAAMAIDTQEHDLAVLRGLLDAAPGESVRGRAQYLLRLNEALRRTVTERWARTAAKWTQYRRPGAGHGSHPRGARDPAARPPALLGHGAAALRVVPVPVPAERHSPAAGRRAAGAAAAPRSTHQGQHRPPDPGGRDACAGRSTADAPDG